MNYRPLAIAVLALMPTLVAQQPIFEAASVKPHTANGRTQRSIAGNRLTITAMPLADVILSAYGLEWYQLDGVPQWAASLRVDIVGTARERMPVARLQQMLQPLLVERFKLAMHRETREMDALALTIARDGRIGPRLSVSTADCAAALGTTNGFARNDSVTGADVPCGIMPGGAGRIVAKSIPMIRLAALIAPSQQKPVVDRTGLTGRYDVDLTYTPEVFSIERIKGREANLPPGVDPNGPPLVTALQDQLGLKLEATRAPIEVVVIDRLEPLVAD